MAPRIAIPEPTSDDSEYNARALPQYLEAIKAAGAEPVVVALADTRERIAQLLAGIDGILLPGSGHDVDPALYGEIARARNRTRTTPPAPSPTNFFLRTHSIIASQSSPSVTARKR